MRKGHCKEMTGQERQVLRYHVRKLGLSLMLHVKWRGKWRGGGELGRNIFVYTSTFSNGIQ